MSDVSMVVLATITGMAMITTFAVVVEVLYRLQIWKIEDRRDALNTVLIVLALILFSWLLGDITLNVIGIDTGWSDSSNGVPV